MRKVMAAEKPERRDPARTMALLWRARDEPTRGPRQGLTVDRIVAAGIEIADAAGLGGLSMRRVADRLGVGTMSLYTYVAGKADLVAAMRDAVVGETAAPDGGAGGWRATLATYAQETWALYHRHPWTLLAPWSQELLGPNETARMDAVLGALAGAGLDERETVGVVVLIDGYVRGTAALSMDFEQTAERTGVTEADWWAEREPLLARFVTASRFPSLTAVWAAGAFDTPDTGFDFGLARVLDGIGVLVEARRPTGTP
jgi:AcrR family transcriptional regulator